MVKIQKKGQGLSINTIIISIIALVVLVVLVAIFTGRLGIFSSGITSVQENKCLDVPGGHCISKGLERPVGEVQAFGKRGCLEAAPICCIPTSK